MSVLWVPKTERFLLTVDAELDRLNLDGDCHIASGGGEVHGLHRRRMGEFLTCTSLLETPMCIHCILVVASTYSTSKKRNDSWIPCYGWSI